MRARRLPILIGCALLGSSLLAQVSSDRILNAQKEPHNWLTYSGTYMSQRYSQLTQITPANVRNLELKWVFQARWLDYNQATPLVVDGVVYTTQGNDVLALDATTGKIFWIFPYTPSSRRAVLLRPHHARPGDPRRHIVSCNDRCPPDCHRRQERPRALEHGRGITAPPVTR